jgi:type IV pilus assembly protein PilB
MILVTGPTGSGKSTTLYAMLARLEADRLSLVNMSTIEDPVESILPRVTQVSVNAQAGIDFASGLRALLRQDPALPRPSHACSRWAWNRSCWHRL